TRLGVRHGQVCVRDRGVHGVAVAAGRHAPDDAVADPYRLVAKYNGVRIVQRDRAESALRPTLLGCDERVASLESAGLAELDEKPSPASYGVVSGVMSAPQSR